MFKTVTSNFKAVLTTGPAADLPFSSAFIWSEEDPVLFLLAMNPEQGAYVDWTLSRELLKEALTGPSCVPYGEGDMRYLPLPEQGALYITLNGDDGSLVATISVPFATARHFLEQTEEVVPVGTEDLGPEVDYALLMILG